MLALVGLVGPLVTTLVVLPFRDRFAGTAAALVLVTVIVAISAFGTRVSGVLATISACAWFDFFLTQPYERFAISHRVDIQTTVSLFVVGLAVTELAQRAQRLHQRATEQSDYVARLYGLADMIATGAPSNLVIAHAERELTELLHLRACRFEPDAPHRTVATIGPRGEVVHAGLLWAVHQLGLPGAEAELPVQHRGRTVGRFVLVPTPGWPIPVERRIVAVALADEVGGGLVDVADTT